MMLLCFNSDLVHSKIPFNLSHLLLHAIHTQLEFFLRCDDWFFFDSHGRIILCWCGLELCSERGQRREQDPGQAAKLCLLLMSISLLKSNVLFHRFSCSPSIITHPPSIPRERLFILTVLQLPDSHFSFSPSYRIEILFTRLSYVLYWASQDTQHHSLYCISTSAPLFVHIAFLSSNYSDHSSAFYS